MSEVKIKNILNKPLKKEYQVAVPYSLIDEKINQVVEKVRKNYKLDGFRTGQVPTNIIKQKYEASIMADESEKIINETSKKIVKDNNLKLALTPNVEVKVFEAKKDFEYNVSMEIFPEVPEIELTKIKLSKRNADISKTDIDESINKIVKRFTKWDEQPKDTKAKIGNAVNIDYVGKIDKEIFEGGSAQNHQLELGSKSFIDNFEDQLVGKKAGDEVKVKVKFPKEYHNDKYAGKAAEFDVKINSVSSANKPEVNDEFVKNNFGLESLVKLEEAVKEQISANYETMSKNFFKKELFDFLNKKYDFDLPTGLVEEHLEKIWAETESELKHNPEKFKNDKEKEKAKEEKRKESIKMVRSGIILSELSRKHNIKIEQNDVMKEVNKRVAQFPGQEKFVIEYYQKNPAAIDEIRGVVLEEKVVNFILEKSSIENKKLSIKDFEKEFNKAFEA